LTRINQTVLFFINFHIFQNFYIHRHHTRIKFSHLLYTISSPLGQIWIPTAMKIKRTRPC
jgi:hypothetical protein